MKTMLPKEFKTGPKCDAHGAHTKWLESHDKGFDTNAIDHRNMENGIDERVKGKTFYTLLTLTITVTLFVAGSIHIRLNTIQDNLAGIDKKTAIIETSIEYLSKQLNRHMLNPGNEFSEWDEINGNENKNFDLRPTQAIYPIQNSLFECADSWNFSDISQIKGDCSDTRGN
jgi:hypothetical protein